MFSLVLLVAIALLLDVCCALGPLRQVRPPSVRRLDGRSSLENIEGVQGGVVDWGNATTPQNAAIVEVVLSEDKLCVPLPCISAGRCTHCHACTLQVVLHPHRSRQRHLSNSGRHGLGGPLAYFFRLYPSHLLRTKIPAWIRKPYLCSYQREPDSVQRELCGWDR